MTDLLGELPSAPEPDAQGTGSGWESSHGPCPWNLPGPLLYPLYSCPCPPYPCQCIQYLKDFKKHHQSHDPE